MVYMETTPIDILWRATSIVANLVLMAGGLVSGHLGEPAGRVAAATAALYAAVLAAIALVLLSGLIDKVIIIQLFAVFCRGLSLGAPQGLPSCAVTTKAEPNTRRASSSDETDSDSGTASSTTSTQVAGRSVCQSSSIWLGGVQSKSLSSTRCT